MYTELMKNCLRNICQSDAKVDEDQSMYAVNDAFASIELYTSSNKVSFKVKGDAYITAMVKWLQVRMLAGENISLLTLKTFTKKFNLPENKVRNAALMMELIEQIK